MMKRTYAISTARFSAGEATVTPTAQEYTCTMKFWGADKGVWPGSTSNTVFTVCCQSLGLNGGEETRDFKCAMDYNSKMRGVGQATSIRGTLNLDHPSRFLDKFITEGPLCEFTLSSNNQTDPTHDQSFVFQGRMKVPDMTFLDNPGTVSFEIEAYGAAASITIGEA